MHCCFPCVADFFLSQVEKYVSLIPVHEFYHFQSPFSFRFDCPYSFRVLVLSSFSFRVNIFAVIYIYIYVSVNIFGCYVVISLFWFHCTINDFAQTTFSFDPASGTQIVHKYVLWYLDIIIWWRIANILNYAGCYSLLRSCLK